MVKTIQTKSLNTEQRIHNAIIDIFMEKGWEAISYTSIAKHTGLSRGGVQRIVPNKDAMVGAFQGKVAQQFSEKLDFSTETSITESWINALDNAQFRNCLKFFIGAIATDTLGKKLAKQGFEDFCNKIGSEKIQLLIGLSVCRLLDS